jgi:hypothetical protein
MKKRLLIRRRQTSSALVITLLGIVLLTIIVVAFMQTSSLSLTTAKSYTDVRRANLAAQAGLDTAIAQISLAAGTNLAFVTGQTNYPLANFPVTVIGEGNLTNLDQMMPLVSGPLTYLTNFATNGFSANFNTYASARTNGATQTVDVNVYTGNTNSPYPYIQNTSDVNMYRAAWVTMTNMVGSQVSYTRYAYIVLDDAARMNPALMTGTGTGYTSSTNWSAGPQDINATYLTNSAGAQVLTPSQLALVTAASNSFAYSDATLGETFSSRANYEAVKSYFTSMANPTFDVIPAWYPSGGMPKYNINDLATNTAYGTTPLARALNIAGIITNNLPNFYLRDAALSTVGTNNTPGSVDKTLYVKRLAANIVDYISPDGTWGTTDYSTNMTGISPTGHGIYPISIAERAYVQSGAGDGTGTSSTSSTIVIQTWISCWNPYTTPVIIKSAFLNVRNRPGYILNRGPYNNVLDLTNNPLHIFSGAAGTFTDSLPQTVQPNEFVVFGFSPQTNTISPGDSGTNGPAPVANPNGGYEQFSLTINGQTTAQTGANNPLLANLTQNGGISHNAGATTLTTNNTWSTASINCYGNEVGDPRFESYYNDVWPFSTSTTWWKGVYNANGSFERWAAFIFPAPLETSYPMSTWADRDNMARSPANAGSQLTSTTNTPESLPDEYNTADASAAPEVIRNGVMVSIGELGHVADPAYANDILTALAPRYDGSGSFTNPYSNGGARSLRIGRPEANGTNYNNGGSYYSNGAFTNNWDVNGERAISLLDLFTINNANTSAPGVTNTIAQSMMYGGAMGRVNINTASSNVLATLFAPVEITSDPTLINLTGGPTVLTNVSSMASNVIANRPYSSLSDLYKIMPIFDTNINYYPNLPTNTASSFNWQGGASLLSYYPSTLNVFNRVHQEAFGKIVQHLTVQSRTYRIYAIGQVLDSSQNPRGSVAMEAGVYLQYNGQTIPPSYQPIIQYVRILK